MKCCPEFCLWRRFRQALGRFFYANMAPEPHPVTPFSNELQANQLRKRIPLCSFWLCPAKNGPVLSVRLHRASIAPIARSTRIPGAERAAREHHVTLRERGQDPGQEAI